MDKRYIMKNSNELERKIQALKKEISKTKGNKLKRLKTDLISLQSELCSQTLRELI